MKKYFFLFLPLMVMGWLFVFVPNTSALSLKIAPLDYRTTLKQGEKKRGFIDVSNPTGTSQKISTSVQAFRQTDDQGSLSFYDNEQVRAGIKLDLQEFEVGPREAVRMYFELDGTKLPTGDVFAAIFLSTQPAAPKTGVAQSLRLGSLLSIINGTPGVREAQITKLDVPFLQFDTDIQGAYTIKNTADPTRATGFYPTVKLRSALFGETKSQQGKLVFAGKSRQNQFHIKTPPLGLYKVIVGYKDSVQARYVFVVTPQILVILAGGFAVLLVVRTILKRFVRTKVNTRTK